MFRKLYEFDRGKSLVSRFSSTFRDFGIAYTVLAVSGYKFSTFTIAIAVTLFLAFLYVLGVFYVRFKIDKIEKQVTTERDPIVSQVNALHQVVTKKGNEDF